MQPPPLVQPPLPVEEEATDTVDDALTGADGARPAWLAQLVPAPPNLPAPPPLHREPPAPAPLPPALALPSAFSLSRAASPYPFRAASPSPSRAASPKPTGAAGPPLAPTAPPESIPLKQYAEIAAEIAVNQADRDAVLHAHGLTPAAWAKFDAHWTESIATDSERGEGALLAAFEAAYLAAQGRVREKEIAAVRKGRGEGER